MTEEITSTKVRIGVRKPRTGNVFNDLVREYGRVLKSAPYSTRKSLKSLPVRKYGSTAYYVGEFSVLATTVGGSSWAN